MIEYGIANEKRKETAFLNVQFKKGVLEMLVLSLVNRKDCYGFELVTEISKDVDISEGTIYPLLKRLKDEGNLETYLLESPGGAPRKYYRITELGQKNKAEQVKQWHDFIQRVSRVLDETDGSDAKEASK